MNSEYNISDKIEFFIESYYNSAPEELSPSQFLKRYDQNNIVSALKYLDFNFAWEAPLEQEYVEVTPSSIAQAWVAIDSEDRITHPNKYRIFSQDNTNSKAIKNSYLFNHYYARYRKTRRKGIDCKLISTVTGKIHNGSIGMSGKKYTSVLYVDLDQKDLLQINKYNKTDRDKNGKILKYDINENAIRNGREHNLNAISKLCDIFGAKPIMIEKSYYGALHAAWKFDGDIIPQNIVPIMKKLGYNVEVRTTKKMTRLPGAYGYFPGDWDSEFEDIIAFDNPMEFASFIHDNKSNPEYIASADNYMAITAGFTIDELYEIIDSDIIEDVETPEPDRTFIPPKYSPYKKHITNSAIIDMEKLAASYPISAGTRDQNSYMLACKTAPAGYDIYSQVYDMACDGTSRDNRMKSPEDIEAEKLRVYKNMQRRTTGTPCIKVEQKVIEFRSNAELIKGKGHLEKYLCDPRMTAYFLNVLDLRSEYHKVNEQHHVIISTVLIEMFGSMVYQHTYKRKLADAFIDRWDLLSGFQFSRTWCNALQRHYGFKVNIYRIVRKILNHLTELFSQWKPVITKDDRTYQHFGMVYCTQYCYNAYHDIGTGNLSSAFMVLVQYVFQAYKHTAAPAPIGAGTDMMLKSFYDQTSKEVNLPIRPPG